MAAGHVDHAALAANYQNQGDIYEDTKTEGAFGVLEQQINDNWDATETNINGLANHKSASTLDHPDGSVTTSKLANQAVSSAKLGDSAVVTGKLADGAATTQKIGDAAVTSPKIANGAVDSSKLADIAVVTTKLNDLAVTAAKLALSSVTAEKIADGNVTAPKIASGAVGSTQLADGAVTRSKIASQAVGASQIDATLLNNFGDIAVQAEFDRRGIDVMKYGAKGDGVTDDTSSIQSALTVGTGSIVILPKGNYKISSTLTIPDNTTIFAYGARIFNTLTHITMLSLGEQCKIFGLELEGKGNSSADTNGIAISFNGSDATSYKYGLVLEDCYIHGLGFYGVYLQFVERIDIIRCRIENIGYSAVMGLSVNKVNVDDVRIKGVTPGTSSNAYGVAFTRDSATSSLLTYPRSKDCKVTNSLIEDIPLWEALDTHSGDNILFSNNTIRNCKIGIAFVASLTGGTSYNAPQNCKAIGNMIYGIGTGAGISLAGAPSQEYAKNCLIQGNSLYQCGEQGNNNSAGIYVVETRQAVINGNTLNQCYANGINMYNNNLGFSVTSNTVLDVQDNSYTVPACIAMRSSNNTGIITGNSLLRVDTGINTYVSVRGLNAANTTGQDLVVGQNYNTCSVEMVNIQNSTVKFGSFDQGVNIYTSTASPEGVITASPGSYCFNKNGGIGTVFYVKSTGTGNTGWKAMQDVAITSISATPSYLGQFAAVGGIGYMAVGTSSSADWKQITA